MRLKKTVKLVVLSVALLTFIVLNTGCNAEPDYDEATFKLVERYVVSFSDIVVRAHATILKWATEGQSNEMLERANSEVHALRDLRDEYLQDDSKLGTMTEEELRSWDKIEIVDQFDPSEKKLITGDELADSLLAAERNMDTVLENFTQAKINLSEENLERLENALFESNESSKALLDLLTHYPDK